MINRIFLQCGKGFKQHELTDFLESEDIRAVEHILLAEALLIFRDWETAEGLRIFLGEIARYREVDKTIPILVFSHHERKDQVIQLYEAGIDCLDSPAVQYMQLAYRLKRVIRFEREEPELSYCNLRLKNYRLEKPDGSSTTLQKKEYWMLQYLFCHPEQLIPVDFLIRHIFKEVDFFACRTLDILLARIRRYLHNTGVFVSACNKQGFILSKEEEYSEPEIESHKYIIYKNGKMPVYR